MTSIKTQCVWCSRISAQDLLARSPRITGKFQHSIQNMFVPQRNFATPQQQTKEHMRVRVYGVSETPDLNQRLFKQF